MKRMYRTKHKISIPKRNDYLMIKSTFIRRLTFVLVFMLIGMTGQLYASHIVGGDISYRCLGNNRYEITLTIYRDCENALPGATFDDPAVLGAFDARGNLITTVGVSGQILMKPLGDPELISTGINPSCDPDFDPVCVERQVYVHEVVLPFREGGYILAHQRCCRNMTLSNIIEPQEQGSTYTVSISEEALNSCNNGEVLNDWPPVYVCFGDQLNINHSSSDADGDQLVYSLCTPNEGATRQNPRPTPPSRPPYDPIVWAPGFDETMMLGESDNPLQIDPTTGVITGTPQVLGQFVVGVCVEEFRNGELLSRTVRDFQLNVVACGEIPRARFEMPTIQCGDLNVSVSNESENASYYEWLINGIDNNFEQEIIDEFEPELIFPDTGLYSVTLLAYDSIGSACVDTFIQEIRLRNTGLELDFEVEVFECGEFVNVVLVDLSTDSVSVIAERNWEVVYGDSTLTFTGDTVMFQVERGGEGSITLTVVAENECTETLTIDFVGESDQGLIPDFSVEIIKCEDDYRVRPIDESQDDQGEITSWTWILTDASGTSDTLFGEVPGEFNVVGFQEVTLSLTIESTSECVSTETRTFPLTPTVNFDPEFSLFASECEERLVIDFRDESYDGPEGTPVSWDWTVEFVSGDESGTLEFDVQNFTLEFDTTTSFIVTLCVTYELDGAVVCENTCTTKELIGYVLDDNIIQSEFDLCSGLCVELNPNPLPGLDYIWECCPGEINPEVCPDETTAYNVTIVSKDINCSADKTVTVTVIDGDEPMDFDLDEECGSLEVTVTVTQGNPDFITGWDFGDGTEVNEGRLDSVTHVYAEEGTYFITMFTDGNCGPMEVKKEVTVRFIDLSSFNDTIINCDRVAIELFPGAPDGFIYEWEPADLVDDPTAPNPTTEVGMTTEFSVTITDPDDPNCIIERTVLVIVADEISLDVDDIIVLCEPEELTINADSPTAVTYEWQDGEGNVIADGPTLVYTPQIDEVITVTVIDEFGCEVTRSVAIEFFKVVFTIDGDEPLCLGDTVTIEVGSPNEELELQYLWEADPSIITDLDEKIIIVNPSETTTYNVQIAYPDGCILDGSYTLDVFIFPDDLGVIADSDTILVGESTELCVEFNPNYMYEWQPEEFILGPNDGNCIQTEDLDEDVEFVVLITDISGCEAEFSSTVTVADLRCDEPYIFVPNFFSPNGDGVNDLLLVRIYEPFMVEMEFVIYNRWGQEIFRTTDLNRGWDGTFNNEEMPTDAYGYYLRVNCIDGEVFNKSGSVNLVR